MIQCESYQAEVSPGVCAARHRKALRDPDIYTFCGACGNGKKAALEIKEQPKVKRPKVPQYNRTVRLCPKCGRPTRGKICAKCKIEEEQRMAEKVICKAEGCTHWRWKKGLCRTHYYEKYGRDDLPQCNAEGCDKQRWKGGYCYKHYKQSVEVPAAPKTEEKDTTQKTGLRSEKKAIIAQMMLCSQTLDAMIRDLLAQKTDVSIEGIYDVRTRLGEIAGMMMKGKEEE